MASRARDQRHSDEPGPVDEEDLIDDDNEDWDDAGLGSSPMFGTLRADPFGRWPAGAEPIREVEVLAVEGNAGDTWVHRSAQVTIPAGVLPVPEPLQDDDDPLPESNLRLLGRWNATWRGARLSELSLDCFSEHLDEVIRLSFQPDHQADLLTAYTASFPGLWSLEILGEDFTALNRRDQIMGHMVCARDPRLAVQIATRIPGVCHHTAWMEGERLYPTKISSDEAAEIFDEINVSASLKGEAAPGALLATDPELMQAFAVMQGEESEKPMVPFLEPIAATLDTYTLVGAYGLSSLEDATLLRVPADVASALSANLTFPDAITAIRQANTDRMPLWFDFTDDDGNPFHMPRVGGPDQPLYGVLIVDYNEEEPGADARVIVPVGRATSCVDQPIPLGALGVGPDDSWRYPMPENQIGLMTAHRGGVQVRHIRTHHDLIGSDPPITAAELNRELAGYVTRSTEWILARLGGLLKALDDGVLLYEKVPATQRTFTLVRQAPSPKVIREVRALDAWALVRRLRELGSVGRVAEAVGADILTVREALDRIGVDPDQVRRDETLSRFRKLGTVEAVMATLPIHRSEIERFLTEAGVDWQRTPVPHDVTDPQTLAMIAAYREQGTLEGAGTVLEVSGETVRRRLAAVGLKPEDIVTEARQQLLDQTVEAWRAASGSLASAARQLGVDPRTVKDRLNEAGAAAQVTSGDERSGEAARLLEMTGSVQTVSMLLGVSQSTVRRWLEADGHSPSRPAGRPKISDDALDQVEMAFAEHGSIRAAARAIGMSPGGFNHRLKLARTRHKNTDTDTDTDTNIQSATKERP